MNSNYHKNIVVGGGEVGMAIAEILTAPIHDPFKNIFVNATACKFLHICIPFSNSKKFSRIVKDYRSMFGPTYIVVHSSVPVGTCDALGVIHSPIRGVHPNLTLGIRTFVKYFGGKNAFDAAVVFMNLGIQAKTFSHARTTEALKLWDTTQYGLMIYINKRIHNWCIKNNVDFNTVYTDANKSYDEGYTSPALGMPHVVRPYLEYVSGAIGGHCVLPNAKLLDKKIHKLLKSCSSL